MQSFQEMAASRRKWISDVLMPWCRQANFKDLREAEHDWINIAGRVDPAATLWTWAWSRYPALVHERLPGVNETLEVRVQLASGKTVTGYPDNRESARGQLVLTQASDDGSFEQLGPFNIDEIVAVELTAPDQSGSPETMPNDYPDRPITTLPPDTPHDRTV